MQDNSSNTGIYSVEGRPSGLAIVRQSAPRIWTPAQGASGLLIVPPSPSLSAVIGGRIIDLGAAGPGNARQAAEEITRRVAQVTLGGIAIVSNARQKEPTKIVGHPDLASGASVQRGDTLYVSVAEAVYRQTRGESVEIHLSPDEDDQEALTDLRRRARQRWENDRLPDGWTRPLAARPATQPSASKEDSLEPLQEELQELADRFRARDSR